MCSFVHCRLISGKVMAALAGALAFGTAVLGPAAAGAAQYDTRLVSRADGATGAKGNGTSFNASVSTDGRMVAFDSTASNLGDGDSDTTPDVFVRDLLMNSTRLASRATGGAGAKGNGRSAFPSVSADGRLVAFESNASNLGDGDNDTTVDVFVRDLLTNSTQLVSRADGASGAKGNGESFQASMSANGRFVAFTSYASNLADGDSDATPDVFVRDLLMNSTRLVSRADGEDGIKGNGPSSGPSTSADGGVVAFESNATNLADGDSDSQMDVLARDLLTNTTRLVSRAEGTAGAKGSNSSSTASVSADGRYVVFESSAANLGDGDGDTIRDVFVRDLLTSSTRLASRTGDTAGAKGNGASFDPSVSADGRYVTFDSFATNLGDGDRDTIRDVFVRDLQAGSTRLLSRADGETGAKGNGASFDPAVSADGRYVAFDSDAANLGDGDSDSSRDVFVRDVPGPATSPAPATQEPEAPAVVPAAVPPAQAPPPALPPPAPPAAPLAAVKFGSLVSLPSTKKCVSRRRFRIRLRTPKGVKITSAEVRVNNKRVRTVKGKRLTAPVDLRSLPKGRFTVRIRIKLADGRTITGTRKYRTCTPKRKSTTKIKV